MPNNKNHPCTPFSVSTSALPGTISSAVSGGFFGSVAASQAITNVLRETQPMPRDSLLAALDVLWKANDSDNDEKIHGLDLFPGPLQNILKYTHWSAESVALNVSLAPLAVGSHLALLPSDIATAMNAVLHSINDIDPFLQTRLASTFNRVQEVEAEKSGFFANLRALSGQLDNISKALEKGIEAEFNVDGLAAKTHSHVASSSAHAATAGSLATALPFTLMIDVIGASLREISALVHFSQEESSNAKEGNIYAAFSACCQSFSGGAGSKDSFQALRDLEDALLDFNAASDLATQHSVSGPVVSVLLRLLTAEPFVKSLMALNASALSFIAAHEALSQENEAFTKETRNSAAKASLLQYFTGEDDKNHHSQHITAFCDRFDDVLGHLDNELYQYEVIADPEPDTPLVDAPQPAADACARSQQRGAIGTVRSESALLIASSLVTGLTGLVVRELSGSSDFTQQDRGCRQESDAVLKSNTALSGADLDNLLSRVCALQERLERCKALGVSAPVALGVTQAVTSGSLIAALNVLAGMVSALRELRTLAASPSVPFQLKDDERVRAQASNDRVVDANKQTAALLGTEAVSNGLSLHQHLASVMDKVVLTHRVRQNFLRPNMDRPDLDAAGKASIASTQGNSTGFLMGSLGVLSLVALQSGIGTEALLGASRYSTEARRLCGGVDRIELVNGFKSNVSFASNATRFSAQSLESSSLAQTSVKTTYHALESTFSRTLLVALCHSGALTAMLRDLIKKAEEALVPAPGFLDSVLTSDAIMGWLPNAIENVLEEAAKEENPVPGLKDDMGLSLGIASNAALASMISSHHVIIAPFLKSIVAARAASNIDNKVKYEALSGISAPVLTGLNIIQAFTRNFIVEIEAINNPLQHCTAAKSSDQLFAKSMVATCCVTLLCEELAELSLSRTLTLINQQKVADTADQSSQQTQQEAALCQDAVREDSGLGEPGAVSHVISALRLTLSHLGVALGNFASEMNVAPDLPEDGLRIHTAQRYLIDAMASAFSRSSSAMLSAAGVLSNLPMSSAGSVESIRDVVHHFDHSLALRQTHCSEASLDSSGSESSLLSSMVTDSMFNILTMATKLLLKASILGLDTALSISKIMEILSLHPRPEEALALEWQALLQPNGLLANINCQVRGASVAALVGTASLTEAMRTDISGCAGTLMQSVQQGINNLIEQVAMLEDEEENEPGVVGLNAFYQTLMKMLVQASGNDEACPPEHYSDLAQRFHRGGIALSSFHKQADVEEQHLVAPESNSLIQNGHFQHCNDADSLVRSFIAKAHLQERIGAAGDKLLDKTRAALYQQGTMSAKSQAKWTLIVSSVTERLKADTRRSRFIHPGQSRTDQQTWAAREAQLLNGQLLMDDDHQPASSYQPG